jgi:hypothetical protein
MARRNPAAGRFCQFSDLSPVEFYGFAVAGAEPAFGVARAARADGCLPYTILLEFFGEARPSAKLNYTRVADLKTTEQVSVYSETVGSYIRISAIVLRASHAESVAQAVQLFGID